MIPAAPKRLAPWKREAWFLVRMALLALPFTLFFGVLWARTADDWWRVYRISFVFCFVIGIFIRANERWVEPRIAPPAGAPSKLRLIPQIASFGVAGMVGSFVAATILHFTILPQIFMNARSVLVFTMFSLLFCMLFLGIGYAAHFYGAYIGRIREEEKIKARIEHELHTAALIQQALLPGRRAMAPMFEAAGTSLPTRLIGGDFLDYFELPDRGLSFVLGDVSGKGPPAAILAAAIQGMFASVAETGERPADAIARVNRALVRRAVESKFATVFHGLLGPDGALASCNAGHNPPLLLRGDGSIAWLTDGGLILGMFEQATFEEEANRLVPGDTLVLFSDGVTEAADPSGEQFGEERLLAIVRDAGQGSPAAIVERLVGEVRAFVAGAPQADDITVLVVRYQGEDAPGRAVSGNGHQKAQIVEENPLS